MSEIIIDPNIISFNEEKKFLVNLLASKPDDTAWKDFYDNSAGLILIELLAGQSSFDKRDLIVNRRENYLNYAKVLSSTVAIASGNLAYPVYRGKNSHVRLKILANQNITISKFDIVGSVGILHLVSLDNYNLLSGQYLTIDCVIGNKYTSQLQALSDELQVFRFDIENISEDFRLFVNSLEVPISTNIIDLINDKWVVISNASGGLDAYYLNTGNYQYTSLTNINLKYIETNNLDYLFPDDINFNYGTVQPIGLTENDTQIINAFISPETIDSIRIKAPLHFETQKVLRGRDDFKKILLLENPNFIDTNGFDYSPSVILLTYLKSDYTTLTLLEKQQYQQLLESYTEYGVKFNDPEQIKDPSRVDYTLTIQIKAQPNKNLTNINQEILEIFKYSHEPSKEIIEDNRTGRREDKFEYILNLEDIEHELGNLEEVKISRVDMYTTSYQIATNYKRGDFVTLPSIANQYYECIKAGTSSNIVLNLQPSFNNTHEKYVIEDIPFWTGGNYSYNLDDIVLNSLGNKAFIVITPGLGEISAQPNWDSAEIDEEFSDNQVRWKCIDILSINTVIWKCLDKNTRLYPVLWNEFIKLNYGTQIIWLQ